MSERYILALDQGTTSSRSILFDAEGRPCASVQREFAQHYPQPGWVEHDPRDIWSSQSATIAEVIAQHGVNHRDLAAIGISNQRETVVVWDRASGRAIHPAIVWQDRRTADLCQRMKRQGLEEPFVAKTGLRLDPYFSGTKVKWLLDHVDGARARAAKGEVLFGTIDSWLIWNLTEGEVHATDATNASRTLLYNIHTGDWDDELLDILDVPREMLPAVRGSSEIIGHTRQGVPIAGVAGDQQAALFGQACFDIGTSKNTYGTGCFLLATTGDKPVPSRHNLLTTVAWKLGDRTDYALEGSIFIAGAVIQWLRDELGLISSSQECDRLAASVPDANGAFLVPAFVGLGAPHWDPYARGAMFGLTRGVNRAHLCRAALESIAFQSADLVDSMEADAGIELTEMRVDGGVTNSDPMLQFQADLLRRPVVRPKITETTALGAAYLAGLATGYWDSRDQIRQRWAIDRRFEPKRSLDEMRTLQEGWRKAVQRSLDWEQDHSAP